MKTSHSKKRTITVWLTRDLEYAVASIKPNYKDDGPRYMWLFKSKSTEDNGGQITDGAERAIFDSRMKGGPHSIQKYKITVERIDDNG